MMKRARPPSWLNAELRMQTELEAQNPRPISASMHKQTKARPSRRQESAAGERV